MRLCSRGRLDTFKRRGQGDGRRGATRLVTSLLLLVRKWGDRRRINARWRLLRSGGCPFTALVIRIHPAQARRSAPSGTGHQSGQKPHHRPHPALHAVHSLAIDATVSCFGAFAFWCKDARFFVSRLTEKILQSLVCLGSASAVQGNPPEVGVARSRSAIPRRGRGLGRRV